MDDDVHVWVADPADPPFPPILSPEEHARMRRFHLAADRRSYEVAHGLTRRALSWCRPSVPPGAWRFEEGRYGKPEVAGDDELRFSLSHTSRLVAVAVARRIDCGLDVETTDRTTDVVRLARRALAPAERAAMMALPPSDRPACFFRFWTLKEAYVKARGLGMTVEFDQIPFELRAGIRLGTDGGQAWQFAQWNPRPNSVAALALRTGGAGGERRIILHDT